MLPMTLGDRVPGSHRQTFGVHGAEAVESFTGAPQHAWVLEAHGRGLPKDGAYWQAGWDWIAAERAARRPSAG
jgi:hypothetical protein